MRKQFFKEALLAVALAAFSSTAAMGQSGEQKQKEMTDWLKDVADRVELHGYAQGGFNYTHQNAEDKGTFELKESFSGSMLVSQTDGRSFSCTTSRASYRSITLTIASPTTRH